MTHEELVEDAAKVICMCDESHWDKICEREPFPRFWGGSLTTRDDYRKQARAVLALIAERLKEPTETTLAAAFAAARYGEDMKIHRDVTRKQYCAMLAASPLVPPK